MHLWVFRPVRVFWAVCKDEDAKYWATNDLKMTEEEKAKCLEAILGTERTQVRKVVAMLKHLLAQPTYELITRA